MVWARPLRLLHQAVPVKLRKLGTDRRDAYIAHQAPDQQLPDLFAQPVPHYLLRGSLTTTLSPPSDDLPSVIEPP